MDLNLILKGDQGFVNFLYICWKALGLPKPTPVQLDIAYAMQHGNKRMIIQAFRGVGKSYICSAYVVWRLWLDPQLKIMVISGSRNRADDFTTFTLALISLLGPITAHLIPREDQACSKVAFDVGPATPSHARSVTSRGITGSLTGSRADLIIADDIETWANSQTAGVREKTFGAVAEFESMLKPEDYCRIIYLGTPQCEDTLYNRLKDMNYLTTIWPSRMPEDVDAYGGMLADYITNSGLPVGAPVDPERFDDEELYERELSMGRSVFNLQFQLDTSLSDKDRYPLKLTDLIVMDLDNELVPEKVTYAFDPRYLDKDLMCWGMGSDSFYRPFTIVGGLMKPKMKVLAIDPSGRGGDETSYASASSYGGQYFLHECSGIQGGYEDHVLDQLVQITKSEKPSIIVIESNFGDGMFRRIFEKRLALSGIRIPCVDVRSSIQKEKRIIDTLEPVMNSHKLIVNRSLLERDITSVSVYPREKQRFYSLQYQISRITRDRQSLKHDDRLDALQMAIGYLLDFAGQDADEQIHKVKEAQREAAYKLFAKGIKIGKDRSPSSKFHTWISR